MLFLKLNEFAFSQFGNFPLYIAESLSVSKLKMVTCFFLLSRESL